MKKFILDQALFLAGGIVIIVCLPLFGGPFFTLLFEIVTILCFGYLCRRILLLPFDLIIGKVTKTAYFATQTGVEDLEFFKNKHYCEWKFNLEKNKTLMLLVPIAITPKEAYKLVPPQRGVKYNITYFRLSKIMLEWKEIEEG